MRLVLMGPPGAGKGTQTQALVERYEIPWISTGELLRQAIAANSALGNAAAGYLQRGALVPDEVVTPLAFERLAQADCERGFLLDGYPRTLGQAEALRTGPENDTAPLNAVVLLEVPDDLIAERIVGRRMDPQSGAIYHLTFNPPPPDIITRLVQRSDDTEDVIRARLATYHKSTEPLADYYAGRGLLRRVNGVGTPEDVAERLFAALDAGPFNN